MNGFCNDYLESKFIHNKIIKFLGYLVDLILYPFYNKKSNFHYNLLKKSKILSEKAVKISKKYDISLSYVDFLIIKTLEDFDLKDVGLIDRMSDIIIDNIKIFLEKEKCV